MGYSVGGISSGSAQNLTGVVTSAGSVTSIADNALAVSNVSGLQDTLDLKAVTGAVNIIGMQATIANIFIKANP